jgi:recombinational DNA repair protein (RecF pathway)
MARLADISVMARGGRRSNRRYSERLAIAAAFSLALFAWGVREIRQAF